ncbi:hypothetical protein ONB79_00450 [Candidatus Vidania fulgoroideae]|nr:hypothetical protein ONB79_00450 [Candidatus Vidania fulgoroideae]WDR79227.1 hypothetical protein ONB65_00745 [Candidatus Vidania fulgoroideae]
MRHIPSMFFKTLKRIEKNVIDCTFGLGNYFFLNKLKKKIFFSFEKDILYHNFSKKNSKKKNFKNLNKIIKIKNKKKIDILCDLGSSINQNKKKSINFERKIQSFLIKSLKILKGNGKIIILCFNYNEYKNITFFKKTFSIFLKKVTYYKTKEENIKKNQCSKCAKLIVLKTK